MLCVPTIVKNLLSVSQLAQDNAIFIEFYGDHCLFKDKVMGRRLLRGELSNGLYFGLKEWRSSKMEGMKTNS